MGGCDRVARHQPEYFRGVQSTGGTTELKVNQELNQNNGMHYYEVILREPLNNSDLQGPII
jgi:hypothetical protein